MLNKSRNVSINHLNANLHYFTIQWNKCIFLYLVLFLLLTVTCRQRRILVCVVPTVIVTVTEQGAIHTVQIDTREVRGRVAHHGHN